MVDARYRAAAASICTPTHTMPSGLKKRTGADGAPSPTGIPQTYSGKLRLQPEGTDRLHQLRHQLVDLHNVAAL